MEAATAERRRIGRDLHDGLCQQLVGVAYALESVRQRLAGRNVPEAARVAEVAGLLDEAIGLAREIARGLQPVSIGADGLAVALGRLAERVESSSGVACRYVGEGTVRVRDDECATQLYLIAQEAVVNALRHGKGTRVTIELAMETGGRVRLEVADDGVGVECAREGLQGIGMRTMTDRAAAIGGSLAVRRAGVSGGTVVICTVPGGGT